MTSRGDVDDRRAPDPRAQPRFAGGAAGARGAVLCHRHRADERWLADGAAAAQRNGTTVVLLVSVVVGMVGLSFASVPLYRLFCQATGWGGTTQRATAAPTGVADAIVTVRFDAETAPDLAWEFRPLTRADAGASRRAARGFLSRDQSQRGAGDRHRDIQRHADQERHLFRQAAMLLLYRAASGAAARAATWGSLLCRSRPGEGPAHPRRAARSPCPTRCFASPMLTSGASPAPRPARAVRPGGKLNGANSGDLADRT